MRRVSSRAVLPEVAHRNGQFAAACIGAQPAQSKAGAAAENLESTAASNRLNREQTLRQAILLTFCDPVPKQFERLLHLSDRTWQRLLHWLDVSGLALYFLDRLIELERDEVLPAAVRERLQQNLIDNRERTRNMIAESVAVQQEFQDIGLSYSTTKGFSLYPISVPRPELRHQFDLDFLVTEQSAPKARSILERRGYRLYALSGDSWEFKKNESPGGSMEDLYKDCNGRTVELHVDRESSDGGGRLGRVRKQEFYGISAPVLSPVDLFLAQGLHAFKDVCSSFSRAAHLLEFRRHVIARYDDNTFWRALRAAGGEDRRVSLGIGVVTYLISSVMGQFAPEALTGWTVAALPPSVRLWVDVYGRRVAFGTERGTKLYLLLQKELESAGLPAGRPLKKALLPSRLPPVVIRAFPNEKLSVRVGRYRLQLRVILSRMRFHGIEGLCYWWESRRWRQLVNGSTRA